MVNLNDVRIFVVAVEKRQIREAAASLGLPPSTVSRALTRIEKHAGVLLIERSTRGIRLTDAGRSYLVHCQDAMRRLRDGEDDLDSHRENPRGKLSIGMPTTFAREMVMPFLRRFVEAYPDIRIRFVLHECDHAELPEDVELDIFFQVTKPKKSAWKMRTYPPIAMCLAASPEYLQRAGIPETPDDLLSHRFVSWGPGGDKLVLNLRCDRKKVSLEVPLAISITHASMQNLLAREGLGIGYLQLWEAQVALKAGKLALILPEWKPDPVTFYGLFRQRSSMMPKIAAFMNIVGQYIATEHDPRQRGQRRSEFFAYIEPV